MLDVPDDGADIGREEWCASVPVLQRMQGLEHVGVVEESVGPRASGQFLRNWKGNRRNQASGGITALGGGDQQLDKHITRGGDESRQHARRRDTR